MPTTSQQAPERHLPLHRLEFRILLALNRGSAHAYAVVRSIEASQPEWSTILPTNLYRRIWRLADDGLIREVPDRGEAERPRKYFAITSLGREVAAAEATRLRGLLAVAEEAGIRPSTGEA